MLDEIPDQPITYQDGRPVPWFSQIIRQIKTVIGGVESFIGYEEGGTLTITADQVQQGITNKVTEILKKEVTEVSPDGQIQKIEYRNAETDALVREREIAYAPDGTVQTRTDMDSETTVVQTYEYDGSGRLERIIPQIDIGGLF